MAGLGQIIEKIVEETGQRPFSPLQPSVAPSHAWGLLVDERPQAGGLPLRPSRVGVAP
jgi:hypothetical protein